MASIVIPAHNEATVIGRTLEGLTAAAGAPGLREDVHVVVATNGCTDDTIGIAESFADRLHLDVLDLPVASKQAALNGADDFLGDDYPRVYLDADIAAPAASLNTVIEALEGGAVAARPPLEYQTRTADPVVQAYYRARTRTPQVMNGLWGAGCFAVSAEGRRRWGAFPLDAPDDLFVDSLFQPEEKLIIDCAPVPVEVPRSAPALLRTLKRVHRRSEATPAEHGSVQSSGGTLGSLLRSNSDSWAHRADAAAYVSMALGARGLLAVDALATRLRGGRSEAWERDDTTR